MGGVSCLLLKKYGYRSFFLLLIIVFLILNSSFGINAERIDRNETIKTFKMGLEAYNRGDYTSALKYWTPLADQHQPAAQTMIGVMYLLGHGVPKDERKAFAMISEPAYQGYAMAQYHLGIMYMGGQGAQKNEREAVLLFRKSADQGWAPAQYIMGSIYANGEGVEKNNIEAVVWYRKAAERGFAEAQNDLGVCYEQGRGVTKNLDEARKWFELASKQGNSGAATNLERLKAKKQFRTLVPFMCGRRYPWYVGTTRFANPQGRSI